MTRRLLVIAYAFPPVAGVAIERTLRHVGYLPEFGWEPAVVAPSDPGYRLVDESTNARIPPATDVHRAYAPEPAHLRRAARAVAAAYRHAVAGPAGELSSPGPPSGRLPSGLHQRLNELWARLVPLVFFPDEQLLWAPAAASVGMRLHREEPVDAIYSSSPPISSHLAAAVIHSITDVPWIADFRDPWIDNAFAPPLPAIHNETRRQLEWLIVRAAKRTVFATPTLRDAYARRHPTLERRFVTIPNGYDLTELETIPRPIEGTGSANGMFRLVYTGTVYGDRELTLFLDGVEQLLATRPELRERLRVQFIGSMNPANERIAASRFPGLEPVVNRRPQVSRAEALTAIAAADAGLFLLADGPGRAVIASGKMYDYLGLDRPILAVAPPGDARRILEELDWGVVADPTPAGVAMGLDRLLSLPKPARTADPERRYERRRLTARLASLLDEIAADAAQNASR